MTRDRVALLAARIDALDGLRDVLGLPVSGDLAPSQWRAVTEPLRVVSRALRDRLERARRLPERDRTDALGELELALAEAFATFDTFADVLSQRAAPGLGPLLAGCDVLARDGLWRDDSRLVGLGAPIVYCDRGLGASILRQGVRTRGGVRCPIPLVQIPYARLVDKLALTSILHEVGHQALAALGVLPELARVIASAGPPAIRSQLARWSSEIGADLWAFAATGSAHALAARELFALPSAIVLGDGAGVHPPPFVRVLLAFAWCEATWPSPRWRALAARWSAGYPAAPPSLAPVIAAVPAIAAATLGTPLAALGRRPLTALFDLAALAPASLQRHADVAGLAGASFAALAPCHQLAALRELAERDAPRDFDRRLERWLIALRLARRANPSAHGDLRWLI